MWLRHWRWYLITGIEHHRLAPQSELVLSDYDHFMVFTRPDYLAPIIGAFVNRVEAGKAITRANADPSRIAASERPFDPKDLPKFIGVTALVRRPERMKMRRAMQPTVHIWRRNDR